MGAERILQAMNGETVDANLANAQQIILCLMQSRWDEPERKDLHAAFNRIAVARAQLQDAVITLREEVLAQKEISQRLFGLLERPK